jgi:hypothetical protein
MVKAEYQKYRAKARFRWAGHTPLERIILLTNKSFLVYLLKNDPPPMLPGFSTPGTTFCTQHKVRRQE